MAGGGSGKLARRSLRGPSSAAADPEDEPLSVPEAFSEIFQRICDEQGWQLRPSGVQVTWPDGRHQIVSVELFEHEASDRVRLFTTIGETSRLTPVRLNITLRINAELAHGAFAVRDDDLIMVDTHLLDCAHPKAIEASIRFLAETADYYEKAIFETDEY